MTGKQPPDIHVWIHGGNAPAFLREEGQFYEGGPLWRIELVSPVFPALSNSISRSRKRCHRVTQDRWKALELFVQVSPSNEGRRRSQLWSPLHHANVPTPFQPCSVYLVSELVKMLLGHMA